MKYMIILQDSNVLGTCFSDFQIWLHDGTISVAWINSQGKMLDVRRGQLVDGHFDAQEGGE
jgi:hypothetical protein